MTSYSRLNEQIRRAYEQMNKELSAQEENTQKIRRENEELKRKIKILMEETTKERQERQEQSQSKPWAL